MNQVYFNAAKAYYPRFFTKDQVKIFVMAGKIMEEQYKEITGQDFKTQAEA
ncbi:XkdX family protein [Lysinibacillus agricola]|uniref:XkdX family protein n=1 Tax=Lysinibacillus agricola TaxID=2590012 RepID=A0ABX7AKR0_9BACI|nr:MULTISPECIES: XkdX family protein [Lysinibacillus]QQP10407.1 XkdX family protein [Lysinibacillus agricola]